MSPDPEPSAERELEQRLELVATLVERAADPIAEVLGISFAPIDAAQHVESWRLFAGAARAGRVPPGFVVYLHLPFCAKICAYCLLAARKAPPRREIAAYVGAVRREIATYAELLRDLPASGMHVGGGTPTLLQVGELDALLGDLRSGFALGADAPFGVEAHPTTATRDKLEVLARHGASRVSLGVETSTPEALAAVNRSEQTPERVRASVENARGVGLAVNLDLLAGLPGETLESFEASVRAALALAPDSLSVNRYLADKSPLGNLGFSPSPAETRLADAMLLLADRVIRAERPPLEPGHPLETAGYGTQYNFSRKERGYFQQDMIGPTTVLALGHGGLGHVFSGYFYTADGTPADYVESIERGQPPRVLASPVSSRFERAFWLAERACRGAFDADGFRRAFGRTESSCFGGELAFLCARGLLEGPAQSYRKPARRDFHVVHLLAFLAFTSTELAARLAALSGAALPPAVSASDARVRLQQAGAPPTATEGRAALRQYGEIGVELPPSVLWCRIAMAADAANRRRTEGGAA